MDVHPGHGDASDDDVRYLERLGYKQQLSRVMGIWPNFALGFTYLSPVVGIYTLYAYSLATGGGAMFWAVPIVIAGQLMVVLVFAEVVSQFPIAGGIYQWARRLNGRGYGWFTAWMYTWALLVTVAAVAYGAGPYVADLFGANSTKWFTIGTAIVLIAIASVINCSLCTARPLSKALSSFLIEAMRGPGDNLDRTIPAMPLAASGRKVWSSVFVMCHFNASRKGRNGRNGEKQKQSADCADFRRT